jgi:hypothetical protein
LPLQYNDGKPVEAFKFLAVQSQLLNHFQGVTYFPQPHQGVWKFGKVVYRDEIVIFRVLASDTRRSRCFLRNLKEQLKADFVQEEILIVERDVDAL